MPAAASSPPAPVRATAPSAASVTPAAARRARAILLELAKRKMDALHLYEPLPEQAKFHAGRARTRLLRGSNRGGKTLPAAVEIARAVCGKDPHGKYPATNGRCFIVGKDLKHIGDVMWRKLSRAGAFQMVKDKVTGEWRAYRPWADVEYTEEDCKPAPPLIPPRMIKKIAWVNKAFGWPGKVTLTNGWEISFFSSEGKPPRGSDIDLWWFDEEILDEDWYPEMAARVLDRKGRGVWSATPQSGTDALYDLHERAVKQRGSKSPSVEEYVILLAENPHLSDEVKRGLEEDLSEDERRVRIGGEFAILSHLVYPEFQQAVHCIDAFDIPANWARYMVVDPGHTVCAVLFGAVPPPDDKEHEGELHLYDELYLRECDAIKFAQEVKGRAGQTAIQAALIDPNFSVVTDAGTGKTVGQQYSEALQKEGFATIATGTGFIPANDDVDAGITAVRALMRHRADRHPRLRVHRQRMSNWIEEVKRYTRKKIDGRVVDKPNQRKAAHLMDDTRYLALFEPRWVQPRQSKVKKGGAVAALEKKLARRKGQQGSYVNIGPGRKA